MILKKYTNFDEFLLLLILMNFIQLLIKKKYKQHMHQTISLKLLRFMRTFFSFFFSCGFLPSPVTYGEWVLGDDTFIFYL